MDIIVSYSSSKHKKLAIFCNDLCYENCATNVTFLKIRERS